jgi:hypothetical protein
LEQFGVGAQVGGGAGEADLAALHDVGVVGQAQGYGGELLDQQHAGAGLDDRADDRDQAADHHRGQAQRQLVDQHVARLGDQGLGQHDHLLLAAGQGAGQGGEPLFQLGEQFQDLLPAGLGLVFGQRVAGHAQVVLDGQVGEQAAAFGDDRDAGLADPLRAAAGEVLPVEKDFAGPGLQDAADGQDQGGLARAVRAEERGDLAGRDLDRDLPDHGAAAALDGEVGDGQLAHATPR